MNRNIIFNNAEPDNEIYSDEECARIVLEVATKVFSKRGIGVTVVTHDDDDEIKIRMRPSNL